MLRFFRQIRQKLIEQEQVRKYIWYALGEILLVMIGILLALQVNNWNQKRILTESAEEHLLLLKSDLQEDHRKLLVLRDEINSSLNSSKNLMERYKLNLEANVDSMMYELTQLIFEFNFSSDKSALDILLSSGDLGVIQDDIRDLISQYYNSVEYIEERDEIANTFIKNQFEVVMLNDYPWLWVGGNSHPALSIYNDDKRPAKQIDPQLILDDKRMEVMVFARNFQLDLQLKAYHEGILILDDLLLTLENR